ncbi:unnamed protein product [Miscanthus lutarioriparius]|uniref:Uncharacterized protein n=1 Tax=Miscanthus lutarioriparius TaxID=422564 RepID=A0A811QAS8_9POAL|nr:unnamed protein product [Miscanthus lutarioriparius]
MRRATAAPGCGTASASAVVYESSSSSWCSLLPPQESLAAVTVAVAAPPAPSMDLSLALPALAAAANTNQLFMDPTAAVTPALLQLLPPKSEEERSCSGLSSSSVVFDAAPPVGLGLDLNLALLPPAEMVM